jgi:hypothetical protein
MWKKRRSETAFSFTACGVLALCAGFYGGQARAAIVRTADADTIVLWHLDDTTPDQAPGGRDFVDSSGNAHHGNGFSIAADQIVMGQPGVLGLATQMLGPPVNKRNFINRATTITTDWTSNSITFEAWVKSPASLSDADPSFGRVIGMARDGGGAISWSLGITSTGALRVFSNNTVGAQPSVGVSSSALTWTPGVWYYVALVSDDSFGTADTAQWTVYRAKDGDTALGTPLINVLAKRSAPTNGFGLGGDVNTGDDGLNRAFNGFIDEAHFSNVVRSESYLTGALVAVPEPSSLFLIGCAVMGFSAARRRRVCG